MGELSNEEEIEQAFEELLHILKEYKPNDRSTADRYWAITITEVEKARAVFSMYAHTDEM